MARLAAHIATVGKAMASNEAVAYPILRKHDVDYILVIFGGLLGYSGYVLFSAILAWILITPSRHLTQRRHQQVLVDGSNLTRCLARRDQGIQLLHPPGRVQGRRSGVSKADADQIGSLIPSVCFVSDPRR